MAAATFDVGPDLMRIGMTIDAFLSFGAKLQIEFLIVFDFDDADVFEQFCPRLGFWGGQKVTSLTADLRVDTFAIKITVYIVVKFRGATGCLMAFTTIVPQDLIVGIVFEVTVFAANRFEFVFSVWVALVARHELVKTGEGELRIAVVIEGQSSKVAPTGMATAAIDAKFAVVDIFMTTRAVTAETGVFDRGLAKF